MREKQINNRNKKPKIDIEHQVALGASLALHVHTSPPFWSALSLSDKYRRYQKRKRTWHKQDPCTAYTNEQSRRSGRAGIHVYLVRILFISGWDTWKPDFFCACIRNIRNIRDLIGLYNSTSFFTWLLIKLSISLREEKNSTFI